MILTSNLGFPRIGQHRELKTLLESYWKKEISAAKLNESTAALREKHWRQQKNAGISHIPSNDFSLYDHVLDCAFMAGVIPERYQQENLLDTYFAMARGHQKVTAMEMTKWFDTNYHYIVPELNAKTQFKLTSLKIITEFCEAKALGIMTRPVLLGPVSFLLLSKLRDNSNRWSLLPSLLEVYKEVLLKLENAGAEWVQIDEPFLVCDIDNFAKEAFKKTYSELSKTSSLKLLLATYFGSIKGNLEFIASLPINGLHVDLVRTPNQLDAIQTKLPKDMWISLGVIDGRNIWVTHLEKTLATLQDIIKSRGDKIMLAPSCSLLHVPVDLNLEKNLDKELLGWLSFANQKLDELSLLANALNGKKDTPAFEKNSAAVKLRSTSEKIHNKAVSQAISAVIPKMLKREKPFKERAIAQKSKFKLPLLPTTTIGSYPQTKEVREARAKFKKGEISVAQYEKFLEEKTLEVMHWQDEMGIDVPVHGEFERNDMVEYFGEQLDGFAFTEYGWVQSYGSRCVKPPIIYGDVSRPKAMTVRWSAYAQKQTTKPVKGMLTGPVTILQWSFVRDDQPRSLTCQQIALAIREEVSDLEKAGIRIIQIDEPALREGLPLKKSEWQEYLNWAVNAFLLSSCCVSNETQIHTHMCYSDFNDIIEQIAALDADVISIETSRSAMELLDVFAEFKYPNDIGPGIYDIHSPRVPTQVEIEALLEKALNVLSPSQLWVNPDCGLKTRSWEEVKPALMSMIAAAHSIRKKLESNINVVMA